MDDNDIYTHLFRLLDRMIRLCETEEAEAEAEAEAEKEPLPATPQAGLVAKHVWANMLRKADQQQPVAIGSIRYDPAAIQMAAQTRYRAAELRKVNRDLREERIRLGW